MAAVVPTGTLNLIFCMLYIPVCFLCRCNTYYIELLNFSYMFIIRSAANTNVSVVFYCGTLFE